MKVLVANLGSTSFKYRLYDMRTEQQLARGGIDRIGQAQSKCVVEIGSVKNELETHVPNHAAAVQICLDQLTNAEWGCLSSVEEVAAIGFKAVFAGKHSGIRVVTDELLDVMESYGDVAPAHNPPYARAMRQLRQAFPKIPLVAALETAFHETIPEHYRTYAVPYEWKEEFGIQRWGFHGASHRYIGGRIAELLHRNDLRVISCHLGGSNSLCAMKAGLSLWNTLGMSPQTGLPHNNRVGTFDPFALPILLRKTGKPLEELLHILAEQSGLLGISGLSQDVRDLEDAAAKGHSRATLALNVFAAEIRQAIGAALTVLDGADAIVFTAGIGENSKLIRKKALANLEFAGIHLDPALNETAKGECRISRADSRTEIWIVPTNEEIIVARQTAAAVSE